MRKTLLALSAATAVAMTTPALAQSRGDYQYNPYPWVAGAAVGTTVGLGLYHGWFGTGALASALPVSAAGAAVAGGVAGVGTIALIDAATQPCSGFRAMSPFAGSRPSGCANGRWVGYQTAPARRYRG